MMTYLFKIMEKADIKKHVLEYALNRQTPFTAAIAFDSIDAIETAEQVSDSLGRLYHERILARRKVDKVRYEYIRADLTITSPNWFSTFEMAQDHPADEPKTTEPEKTKIKTESNAGSIEPSIVELGSALGTMAELTTKCTPDLTIKCIQEEKPEHDLQPDWLKTAHDIVHGDREKTYGDPGKNLRLIAQYWSTHTGITITETDVCIMMMLLKIARLKNNPDHVDSWIDIAGYAALKNKLDNSQPHRT